MPEISERALQFARDAYEDMIASLLDDPSGLLHPWRDQEPAESLAETRQLGRDLGLDFDELVKKGHAHEIKRLYQVERGEIVPPPRQPLPSESRDGRS